MISINYNNININKIITIPTFDQIQQTINIRFNNNFLYHYVYQKNKHTNK